MNISDLRKKYIKSIVDEMALEGEKAIVRAMATKNYKHDTYNLHDSYGSAVYVNGKLVKDSIRVLDARMKKPKKWYDTFLEGRNEILTFLETLRIKDKGITLIVAAAMPYASILEEGRGLQRKYKVISGARSSLQKIANKYNGTLERL